MPVPSCRTRWSFLFHLQLVLAGPACSHGEFQSGCLIGVLPSLLCKLQQYIQLMWPDS